MLGPICKRVGAVRSRVRQRRIVTQLALGAAVLAWLPRASAEPRPATEAVTQTAAAPADTEIRQALLQELRTDRHLVASSIDVSAVHGIVELRGSVQVPAARARAVRVARVVRGVRAVIDRLRVDAVHRRDAQIARDIRAAFRGNGALAQLPIGVRVRHGVVELSGAISTWDEQQLAERVASSVPGVRFCLDELSWSPAIGRTAALLDADIRARFDWEPLLTHDTLQVQTAGSRVTLSGVVGSDFERRQAVALCWVKGVTEVRSSSLVVDPSREPEPSRRSSMPTDSDILSTIHELAALWPSLPIAGPSYAAASGLVTISGSVPTSADSLTVEGLVTSVVGVVRVDNELRGPWWRPPSSVAVSPVRRRVFRR